MKSACASRRTISKRLVFCLYRYWNRKRVNCGLHSEVDAPGLLGRGFFVPVVWPLIQNEFSVEILRRCRPSRVDWTHEEEILALAEQAAAQSFRNFTAEA